MAPVNALPTEDDSTEVTQQKAANAEESASASEELSAQAESMKEIVSQLVAVVGGSANATQRVAERGLGRGNAGVDHGSSKHTIGTPAKDERFGKSHGAFHEIAKASHKSVERAKAHQRPASGHTIPLDGGDDNLKDFNG